MTAINVGWWNQEQSFHMSFEKAMEKNNLYQGEIETPIQWLHRQAYDLDYDEHLTEDIFEEAAKKQLVLMDDFSQWLYENEYEMNGHNSLWFHCSNINADLKLSEVYQIFLRSKKA
jgi:hypothetical protein